MPENLNSCEFSYGTDNSLMHIWPAKEMMSGRGLISALALVLSPVVGAACTHDPRPMRLPASFAAPLVLAEASRVSPAPQAVAAHDPRPEPIDPRTVCVRCDTDHGVVPVPVFPVGQRLDLATELADSATAPPWAALARVPDNLYHHDQVCAIEHPPRSA